jgi:hypothetical protein
MAQLYLPLEHTEADLVLAGQIAERIDSAELYVAWTPTHGRSVPEVIAELRASAPRLTGKLVQLFRTVRELWVAIGGGDQGRAALPPALEAEQPDERNPAAGEAAA